jgi:4-hydroxy-2-oxoheptanedioate aldolase
MIVHSFDIALFSQRLRHDIQAIRRGAGDEMDERPEDAKSLTI